MNEKHRLFVALAFIAGMAVGCKNYGSVPYATGVPSGVQNGSAGSSGSGGSNGTAQPNLTPIGNMTAARVGHTATLLPDGRVLVAGGDATGRSAELFDPSMRSFTPTGSMTTSRGPHTAILLTKPEKS